jgi:hypothetical protein
MKYNKIIGFILVAAVAFGMGQAMASSCTQLPPESRKCPGGYFYDSAVCRCAQKVSQLAETNKKCEGSSWRRSEGGSGASGTKEYRPGFLPVRDGSVKSGTNTTPSSADDDTTSNN